MSQPSCAVDRAGPGPLTRNRNFLVLWIGQIVSQMGDALFKFGLVVWIVHTADALTLAGVMTVASVPGIILGPAAGALVDRLDRKNIIVFSDIIRGVLVLTAGVFMMDRIFTVAHVYVILVIFGIVQPLFSSAVGSSIPNIVGDGQLQQANSLRQLGASVTSLIAPALAGVLLIALGGAQRAIPVLFIANGLSYLLSGISECFLELPPPGAEEAGEKLQVSFIERIREGIRYVADSVLLRRMLPVLAMMNFFGVPLNQVILPVMVIDTLGLGEVMLGLVQSALAAGLLLAALGLSSIKWTRQSKPLLGALLAHGSSVLLLGGGLALALYSAVSPRAIGIILVSAAFTLGATGAVANISLTTIVQRLVPDRMRGRVFALLNTLLGGTAPLSLGAAGLLGVALPLFYWPVIGGVAVMGGTASLGGIKELRKY